VVQLQKSDTPVLRLLMDH